MDRERWGVATKAARPSRFVSIEAWSTVGGLGVGAVLTAWLSSFGFWGIGIGAVGGGAIGYVLAFVFTWLSTFLKYPRVQLEARVAQLEGRPSNVGVSTPERPAPDFRPELRDANEMLDQEHGDHGIVDGWINGVYDRLFEWSVAIATEFRPPQMVATPESVARRESWTPPRPPIGGVLAMLSNPTLNPMPALEFDPELVRLKTYRDRLLRLVPQ